VSASILKTLMSRGWVDQVGHRNVPGKPALLATTQQFLNDLGLKSLDELPPLEELGALVDADKSLMPVEEVEPDVVQVQVQDGLEANSTPPENEN